MPKPGCPEQSGLCDDAATFLLWKVARPQAVHPLKQNRDFALRGEFLSERSERNQRIAGGIVRKESAAAAPCAFAHDSPGPPFYGRARRARRHLRPARCPQEGYADIIAAALLSN